VKKVFGIVSQLLLLPKKAMRKDYFLKHYRAVPWSGLFFLIFFGVLQSVSAQVMGVSASKLTAIDATLVSPKTLEAEPSFAYIFARKSFDNNGKPGNISSDPDSALILKSLFFRFTYGAGKRLEIGTFITGNLNAISFGAKYRFVEHPHFLAAALLGLNFSDASDLGVRKTGFFGKYMGIAGGVALTENFTDRLSLDVSTQYQNTFSYEGSLSDNYFLDCDAGYYVFKHTLQLAGGFSFWYNHSKTGADDAYGLSFHPGVTIEPAQHFLIVFYTPVDLAGKNAGRFTGFSFAFTFTVL
jgi:hypothetical protein